MILSFSVGILVSVKIDSKIDVDLDGSMLNKILFWNIIENIIAPNIPKLNAITGLTFKKAKIITTAGIKKSRGEM